MCPTSSLQASEHSSLLGNSISNDKSHNFSCDGSRDDDSFTQTKQQKEKSKWYIILLGQSIALSLSCANAASSRLENKYKIRIPTFQTGIVYIILSFHLIPLFWKERTKKQHDNNDDASNDMDLIRYGTVHSSTSCNDKHSQDMPQELESKRQYTFPFTNLPLHTPYTTYILLSILDIEANYLAMLSFQHTSLSSSMLFTSLSILSTVLLRQFVFKRASYGTKRLIGVVLCLIGGCTWLWHEYYSSNNEVSFDGDRETNSTIIYGDLLALAAACLYGLNDVAAEYFVKANNDNVEYLGMLGFFGSIFSFGIQVPLLEREEVWVLMSNGIENQEALLFVCFVILLCFFYISVMKFLSLYDATILNLSLQTCPLWAVALTKMQNSIDKGDGYELVPSLTFFISLAMIMMGMVLYESNVVDESNNNTEVI